VVANTEITCPHRGEIQSKDDFRSARCGESLETKEQHKRRRADLEQSRRETERDSVSIQRFPGFGTNGTRGESFGTRQYFASMSNQRRGPFAIVLVVFAIAFALFWSH
jgi:hypothetical protein